MKKLLCLSVAAAMACTMTACSGSSSSSPSPSSRNQDAGNPGSQENANQEAGNQEAGNAVNLVLYNNKIETVEALQKTADAFHQSHPDISITIETTQSEQYSTSLKTRYASGEAPDIFMVTGKEDLLLWLDNLEDLSDQKWTADMVDISKPDITHEGRIYGFPVGIEGYGYMYRADLFKQAGIETAPKNLDELRNCAGRLKDMGVTPFVNTWGAWYQAGMFYMNAAIAQQEDPYAFIEGLNAGENLIEGNEAFIRLAEMIKLDFDNCDSPLNTDFAAQVSKFGSGTAAMACGGTWNQPSLDDVDPDMEAGLIPMPFMEKDEDNDVLYAGVTTYWVINKDSAVKDAAKEFLNWLVYDEEGQSFLVTELKNIPAFSNITTGTDSIGPLGQTLLSYLEEGKVKGIYNSRYPAGTVQAFGTSIQKFAAGNISQEQLLKELQDTWTSSRR